MASLADLLTQLQEAEGQQAPRAPWRGPGERPAPGMNEPDMMPRAYRQVQPYPVNIPAAIEGLGAMAGVTGGPVGAVTSGAKSVAGSPLAQKLAASGAAFLGLTAPSMANKDEKAAGESMAPKNQAYLDLLGQQAALQKRLDEARAKMETAQQAMTREERTGKGPNFEAAQTKLSQARADFNGLDTQMKALAPVIAKEAEMQSPEYQIKLKKQQDEADAERRNKTMNTSVKEMFADAMPYVPIASMATAAGLGGVIKGNAVSKYNTNLAEMMTRWKAAVDGKDAGLARSIMEQVNTLEKKGPGGTLPAIMAGVGVGELGQILPGSVDYAKAVTGGDLYNKTKDAFSLEKWPDLVGRAVNGALLGGIPAELAAATVGMKRSRPTGYRAETNAFGQPPTTGGPSSTPSVPPSGPGSPNAPGPQGLGTSPTTPQGPAGTPSNSNSGSLSQLLRDGVASGELTTQDILGSVGIKPANQAVNPAGLPKHLTQDDRLAGSKIRDKKTGQIASDPTKPDQP